MRIKPFSMQNNIKAVILLDENVTNICSVLVVRAWRRISGSIPVHIKLTVKTTMSMRNRNRRLFNRYIYTIFYRLIAVVTTNFR